MKKVLMAVAGLIVSGTALATTTGQVSTQSQDVTTTDCTLLKETVKVRLSANVVLAYKCNTDNGYIGLGTASKAGKGNAYGAGNKGGSVTSTTCPGVADQGTALGCAATAANTASTT